MAAETVEKLRRVQWQFASHRVLTVAVRTGVLERLSRGAATPQVVARDLGLDGVATGKIVRALHAMELLVHDGEAYALYPELVPLFAAGPDSYAPALEHSHDLYDGWGAWLEGWLRTGTLPPRQRTAEGAARFADAMWANAGVLGEDLLGVLDLTGVRRVLDLGGSTGRLAVALCEASPELEVTVVDRSVAVELGPERVAPHGVGERVHFVAGDYHTAALGEAWDAVLMSNVLHQEQPAAASSLVARGAAALRPGGRLWVVEFAIDEEQHGRLSGALFAVNMRSFGDCYPESTSRGWMREAGLTHISTEWLGETRWVLTGVR